MIVDKVKRRLKEWRRLVYRWLWLRRHGPSKRSRGVFILGAQRSGTTMLTGCLEQSPEFEVYGEMSIAFENSILRDLDTARNLIKSSLRPFVAFKPLTDSHRAAALLSAAEDSRAIWMYRQPEDRANSAVAKFGDTNLRFLRELIDKGPTDRWEARGITASTLAIIRELSPATMDANSAAATFWLLRNQLFFDQQLENNPHVLLVKYETLVTRPESIIKTICTFIGCEFDLRMIEDIHAGSVGRGAAALSPEVSDLCGGMLERLDRCFAAQWQSMGVDLGPHCDSIGRNREKPAVDNG